ncbi:hypothetical protein OI69_17015 [Pectobacterium fontis]|uniref:Uncharacterized protein n=1 Tax=Pectobacterium fontis TaxID=2558042 RepID=A0A7V8IGB8_9GAMM|nr:hypothetical protein OI69_17015 [Pectobacterium fontis]
MPIRQQIINFDCVIQHVVQREALLQKMENSRTTGKLSGQVRPTMSEAKNRMSRDLSLLNKKVTIRETTKPIM